MLAIFKPVIDASPPLKGPDRAPSAKQFHHSPNVRIYAPDSIHFHAHTIPIQPDGPGGPQNFNLDCVKAPPVMWNRSAYGCATKEFFRRVIRATGLEHI